MYEIKIDQKKNRLYINMNEKKRTNIEQALPQIEAACRQLVSGFTCVTKLSKHHPARAETEDLFQKSQEILLEYGVSRVVRVKGKVSENERLAMKMRGVKDGYPITYASTTREAEKILDRDL
jgi:hypothetical protein